MYGSVVNHIIANQYKDADIQIGMGVTELCWSDRHAFFVKEIIRNKKGEIKELVLEGAYLKALGEGCFDISREPKEGYFQDCKQRTIRKNRKGYFTSDGTIKGTTFRIGKADEYYDISF